MSIDLNRDALVVGICQYDSLRISKELTNLSEQAEQLAQLLETQGGFKVKRLPCTAEMCLDLKESVTSLELKKAIEQLFYPSDQLSTQTALLFFAGHGLRKPNYIGDRIFYDGFLATSEADNKSVYGVSYQWLAKILCNSPIKKQIVFIEACHSGAFLEAIKEEMQKSCFKDKDICLITSSRAHEESLANGLLTQDLLDILKNQNITTDLLIKELNKKEKQPNRGSQRFQMKTQGKSIALTKTLGSPLVQTSESKLFFFSGFFLTLILIAGLFLIYQQNQTVAREHRQQLEDINRKLAEQKKLKEVPPVAPPVPPKVEEKVVEKPVVKPTPQVGETFKDCSDCPDMVVLAGGSFKMGSNQNDDEKPIHEVNIKPFAMGKFDVTLGEFKAFVNATNYSVKKVNHCNWESGKFAENDRQPVQCVSWEDATKYAEWLSKKTAKKYRLPTEAEWEYAARANTSTKWSFGDNESDLKDYAWYNVNSDSKTHEVGGRNPNGFGLHDMHGNVWEWTCSDYGKYSKNNHLECSSKNDAIKSLRGGSWVINAVSCRSAVRSRNTPDNRGNYVGFRVVSVFSL
jgi:formylglycine-generating enzyme required for sulfatase activity